MHYNFLDKAQQEADLQDVVNYLQAPLKVIDDLFYKFPKLSLASKVDHSNQDLYQECERILNYHLPNLINNYCSFSMKYRNEHIIKTENKNGCIEKYTAKTLLLNDLAKIIEEINIIETKFNDINKMDFLVTNRMISNLGQQTNLIAPEYETEKVKLQNQFNYSIYSQESQNTPSLLKEPIKKASIVTEPIVEQTMEDNNFPVVSIEKPYNPFFVVGCTFALIVGTFFFLPKHDLHNETVAVKPTPVVVVQPQSRYDRNRDDNYVYVRTVAPSDPVAVLAYNYNINSQLDTIKQNIHDYKLQKISYPINNETILNDTSTINFLKENIRQGYFNIAENTINKNNDSYKITLTNVPEAKCSDIASHTYNHYDVINVNNKNLSGLNIENSGLNSITSHMCELQHNTIELIQTK